MARRKAAVVLGVLGQKRRARGHHRRQVRVVDDRGQVVGRLLRVAQVREVPGPGDEARIAGHGIGQLHAGVERADHDGLPPAARKPGHGHALQIGVLVAEQDVQPALHVQVERGQSAGAAQVDLVHAVVHEAGCAELSHADPFEVQRQHAPLGLVDAADLLGRVLLAQRSVAVDVQHGRHLAFELLRLVQQRWDPQAGQGLVPQLLDPVAGPAGDRLQPLDPRLGVAPLGGLAAVDDLFQHGRAQPIGLGLPLLSRGDLGHLRHAALAEPLHLGHREHAADDLAPKKLLERGLLGRLRRHGGQGDRRRQHNQQTGAASHG